MKPCENCKVIESVRDAIGLMERCATTEWEDAPDAAGLFEFWRNDSLAKVKRGLDSYDEEREERERLVAARAKHSGHIDSALNRIGLMPQLF